MTKKTLTKKQVLNAIKVHKQLPMPLTKLEWEESKTLLRKNLNLAEVLDVIDMINTPVSQQLNSLSHRASLTSLVLDKALKESKLTQKQIDKLWKEAGEELDRANKKAQEELQKQFKQNVEDLKGGK